jgi:hypothetical protein
MKVTVGGLATAGGHECADHDGAKYEATRWRHDGSFHNQKLSGFQASAQRRTPVNS